ncbi:MAG: hypothetical protein LC798_21595 [Chloroflexi bacterium]|nr:hypothetical protein [Chloroflexota bacterium]
MNESPVRIGTATVRGRTTRAFFVEYSRRRTAVMSALSAGFAVVGVVMLLAEDTEARLLGGASLVLFGGGAVVLAMSVRRPGRFSMTPAGLLVESTFGRAFAPWNEIVSVERTLIQRQEMLIVDVADITRIETSPRLSWLKRLNESMGMPDLAFPTSLLGERADDLERAIAHYIAHPDARSGVGTPAGLERLLGTPAAERRHGASAGQPTRRPAVPTASRALLWLGGVAGLLITVGGALGGSDPGRETSHLLGVLVFGTTSVAALIAAWLLPRRPRAGRGFGMVAAAGAVFIGWLLTQSPRSGLGAVLIGVGVAAAGAYVGWEVFRWWRRGSNSDMVTPSSS